MNIFASRQFIYVLIHAFLDHLKKTQGQENSSLEITQNSSKKIKVSAKSGKITKKNIDPNKGENTMALMWQKYPFFN